MFSSNTTQTSGGYEISRSLRFNSADSAYLNRTPASAGNQLAWTISFWVKRSKNGAEEHFVDSTNFQFYFDASDVIGFLEASTTLVTTQVFRDNSAWYHIVAVWDSANATSSDRARLYINGVRVTAFSTATYPAQNTNSNMNRALASYIGKYYNASSGYMDGYMTEVNFIDGQALAPSSFGETNAQTGVWQPKAYSGSYGTNGFYLNFSDNSNTTAATLGKDYSGNGNNWTPNNFSVTAGAGNDSLVDSPTSYGTDTGVGGEVRGNYCTMNPLQKGSTVTLTNGNLDSAVGASDGKALATIGMSSGKWYAEVTGIVGAPTIGIATGASSLSSFTGGDAYSWGYYGGTGNKYTNGSSTAYGAPYDNTSTVGIAFDADAGTLTFYKNGTTQGTAYTGLTSGPYFFSNGNSANTSCSWNFGQRPFAYTAPSGYKALCTQNLPTPTIGATTATQANLYFNPVLWTGTSANPRTITGVGFQPDFVWVKKRSAAGNNFLQDAVRGVTSTDSRSLVSNATDAETNYYTVNGGVTAFTSDGFTTSGGSTNLNINESGVTYVAWNWKANGSGSTNTAGSITSTVSANTTSGFSVVTFTGTNANATVGHGLGVAPAMVIMKNRAALDSWQVYHISLTSAAYRLQLNSTAAADSQPTVWNSTAPTSTVFSVGTNVGNYTQVAYCFAAVAGYSAFGSYTGNGSADGPFVFTGFRPAYVMVKITSATANWVVEDGTRNPYNVANLALFPNTSGAEYTVASDIGIDFLSNGFKIRGIDGAVNNTGSTFIYMALASNPFKYSLAR